MGTASTLPSNASVADEFQTLADLLQLGGESIYRTLAYEKAAQTFRAHPTSVAELALRGELTTLPGIGAALAGKAEELVTTGRIALLEELRGTFPEDLLTLMRLPGVGPKTARRLWDGLGISTLDELREAAQAGRIRTLHGMGPKTEENLLRAIANLPTSPARQLLGDAEPLAERLVARLRDLPEVVVADYAGSLRRRRSTVRDIDLVVGSAQPDAVFDAATTFPELAAIGERGTTKLAARTQGGLGVDLRVVPPASYGNLLQHLTGSAEHNVALRGFAQRHGFKVSEYDVERLANGRHLTCRTEAEVYARLGLPFIAPELREGRGEIAAALRGELPRLIELSDLAGDLHVHSDWSDGRASMEEMALAARDRGLSYVCFCDHSQSLGMGKGLTPERVLEQIEVVRALDARLEGITVLAGSEVEILADGRIDLPDEVLAALDLVTASIHSGFTQPADQIMGRLRTAMDNPHVDVIGHPTGRLIGRREPYELRVEELVAWAAETGTCLEINASYHRLDLPHDVARLAAEALVGLTISSDAHDPSGYDLLRFGIGEARRGWIEARHVVNTLSLADLRSRLGTTRG